MSDSDDIVTHSPDDSALERAIQALPRSQLPARDLWPELQAQLPRRAPQRARFAWAAAAVLAALALGVWVRPDLVLGTATVTPLAQLDAASAQDSLMNMYESEKAAQLAALRFTSPSINRQLAVWDGAVQQVRSALSYYPEEPQLLLQLDRLYRQQLHYLETLAMQDPQVAALYY